MAHGGSDMRCWSSARSRSVATVSRICVQATHDRRVSPQETVIDASVHTELDQLGPVSSGARYAPKVFSGEFQVHALAVDDLTEADPVRVGGIVSQAEQLTICFKGNDTVRQAQHQLALEYYDTDG